MAREIKLTSGDTVVVDDVDYEMLSSYTWHRHGIQKGSYYAVAFSKGKTLYMHRLILDFTQSPEYDHLEGDHISGDTRDNRRCNLRWATRQQNVHNSKLFKNSTTGYKGVCWDKKKLFYKATIACDNKQFHLGYFTTPEGAAICYNDAAKKLFGEFARLNDLDESNRESPVKEGLVKSNTTGVRGVSWNERLQQWVASIRHNTKTIHLGCFPCLIEAGLAYDYAARQLHGEKAKPNFPSTHAPSPQPRKAHLSDKNRSGYRGISWHKNNKAWGAAIYHDGHIKHLGSFRDPESAARAYDRAAWQLKGNKAKLNFPFAPPPDAERRITYDRVDPADLPYEVPMRVPV